MIGRNLHLATMIAMSQAALGQWQPNTNRRGSKGVDMRPHNRLAARKRHRQAKIARRSRKRGRQWKGCDPEFDRGPRCRGKVSYLYRAGAKDARKRMKAEGIDTSRLAVFRCALCGNYHLGNPIFESRHDCRKARLSKTRDV